MSEVELDLGWFTSKEEQKIINIELKFDIENYSENVSNF